MVKIILIFSFANFLNHWNFAKFKKLFQLIPLALFPAVLIFIQPDLGSTIVYTLVVSVMTFAAGIRLKHLLILFLTILIISPLFWLSLKDYQKARIHTFIDPESDPLGRGYNSIQAIIAVGSGQIFGRGLGHGTQSKLKFLPEHQTDFVFASLAEELGLVGATLLILAYLWLILRLLHITNYTHQRSYYLVMVGITTLVSAQVIINIGMNIGLMPVTGITLPLVSYGGSSIVTILTSLGVAANIARHRQATFAIEIS
jgi:rod shape determining protein RodA